MTDILYRDEVKFREIINNMRFSYLRISLTKDCNAHCSFCHNEGQKIGLRGDNALRQKATMNNQQYEYIADFFKYSFSKVLFTGGEPTLVENLPEIITIFKKRGYFTKITTNGFALDPTLQLQLKNVGLDEINVSLHSLDEKQHAKAFGVDNALSKVLKNISFLPSTFPDKVKINFMGLDKENIPDQLFPMSELSGKYHIPISFLTVLNSKNGNESTLLSNKAMDYLAEKLGNPDVEIKPGKFGVRYFNKYSNGAIWEFDDFRTNEYRAEALGNEYCQECNKLDKCVEGPYALRISDTGLIKPCIIRRDNTLSLTHGQYLFQKKGR